MARAVPADVGIATRPARAPPGHEPRSGGKMSETASMEYGELHVTDGRGVLRFTRRLNHPPEKVWAALIEPEQLAAWFPTTIDGQRAAGASLTFRFEQID